MSLLEFLNLETGASIETLSRIIATAHRRYKVYEIPKRNGGTRTIAHPARELKFIQRVILHEILDKIKPSKIATAYVKGRGIAFNARVHLRQPWIMKLDFRDFFHSIVPTDWDRVARRTEELSELSGDRALLHRTLFWDKGSKQPTCLSIGAPTSPAISNLVCKRLDEWMIDKASQFNVRVTRYADDITVSGPSTIRLRRFEEALESRLSRNKGVKLTLNNDKRGIYGPGERRMVTGLVLTPSGELSIGRGRKREISALVHKFAVGEIDAATLMRAKGLVAFAMSAEPSFVGSLKKKYGDDLVMTLSRTFPTYDINFDDIDDM